MSSSDRHGRVEAQGVLDEPSLPPRPKSPEPSHAPVASDPEVGDTVAGYALLSELGRGGAGAVFKARSPSGDLVALKVLSASKTKRARVVQRFFDEVRAASAVHHKGLIKVLDFIEEENPRRLAYAMEYLPGEPLRNRIKREGTLALRDAIQIGARMCDALGALHDANIVHRDLKPENIMLVDRPGEIEVKLLDFGVVKFLPIDRTGDQGHKDTEKPGTFVGTPRYMAPEQAAGALVNGRADLFSIGVMLFEMITGACPHEGESLRDVVMAKLKGAPRITTNPENEILPQELTDVVDACLQLKPALRPKDARTVASALREADMVLFLVGPVKAEADSTPTPELRAQAEAQPKRPEVKGASNVQSTRTQISSPALTPAPKPVSSRQPVLEKKPGPPSEQAKSAERAESAESGTSAGSSRPRPMVIVSAVLIMLALAVVIAMIARSVTEEDPMLLVPTVPVEQPSTAGPKAPPSPRSPQTAVEPSAPVNPVAPLSDTVKIDTARGDGAKVEAVKAGAVIEELGEAYTIEVITEPLGATITHGAKQLGVTPLTVELPAGQALEVDIQKPGFKAQRLVLSRKMKSKLLIPLQSVTTSSVP